MCVFPECVLERCTAWSGLSVCLSVGGVEVRRWGGGESDLGGAGAQRDVWCSVCERK